MSGSVTIKDVAREANVSIATVSRALNGRQHVAAAVRERVLTAARALHYSPHHAARSLSIRRTHTIGVVLPDLHGEFFSELMRGIDQVARERGLHLLVSSCHGSVDEQREALRATPGRVDGLLLMSPYVAGSGAVAEDLAPSMPVVLMNCPQTGADRPVLNVDNYGGARAMTRHLLEGGSRRIVFIGGPEDNHDARERLRGYTDELAAHPDAPAPRVEPGAFDEPSGHAAGERIAAGPLPDAIFAANDMMALGCLFGLRQAGIEVPRDVALAGFDDVPMARYVHPSLTTMRVDIAALGARALRMLVDPAEQHHEARTDLVPQLIVRASSVRPGSAMD